MKTRFWLCASGIGECVLLNPRKLGYALSTGINKDELAHVATIVHEEQEKLS